MGVEERKSRDGPNHPAVEDGPDDEALTVRAIKNAGSARSSWPDGADALELLLTAVSAHVTRPGLILLDLNLRKFAGLEVLRRIRADERPTG